MSKKDYPYFSEVHHRDFNGNHVIERVVTGELPKGKTFNRFVTTVPARNAKGVPIGMASIPIKAGNPADALMRCKATIADAISKNRKQIVAPSFAQKKGLKLA